MNFSEGGWGVHTNKKTTNNDKNVLISIFVMFLQVRKHLGGGEGFKPQNLTWISKPNPISRM